MVPLLFFYKNDIGIKSSSKVDMPLNKETKPNQIYGFKYSNLILIIMWFQVIISI